jgi:hypothetical protein
MDVQQFNSQKTMVAKLEKKDPKDPTEDCIRSVYNSSFLFFSDFFVKIDYTRVLQEI